MSQANFTFKVDAIKTTSEVIAQSLKEMIFEAELKPGQQLVQGSIAKMFGVSRVPVRDALQILIGMGIAVNVPRHGVIVRRLSRKILNELFEVRKILEGSAIQMADQKINPDLISDLRILVQEQLQALKDTDVKKNERLDDEFHRILYDVIGNDTLIELIFTNWDRIKQARCASTVEPKLGRQWILESVERHTKVVSALEKRDISSAHKIIIENIESSQQEITASLEEMGWFESIA